MSRIAQTIAVFATALATGMIASSASAQGDAPRALALDVVEDGHSVEVYLVARSAIEQRVSYELELIGDSRSRHSGNSTIAAGDRHVLSRLKTGFSDSWCATVHVTEQDGATYTLTAGDCATG